MTQGENALAQNIFSVYRSGMLSGELLEQFKVRATAIGLEFGHVCEKAGVNQATIWRWESGKFSPRLGTLDRIEAVLRRAETAYNRMR